MQQGMIFHQLRSWPHVHTEAKAQRSAVFKFRATDQHFAPRRSKENLPCIRGALSTVGRAWLLGTLWRDGEYAQYGVFADIWKELWKSPEIQWFPVKHFLMHHLEFDYEVNRLEFYTRDVIFPLPPVSSAIKTCLSALTNDNDKCSRGKRCHEKHMKDFSEEKKEPQPHAELHFRGKIMLNGRQKMKCLLPCWGSDRQGPVGAWGFGCFSGFQTRQGKAFWEKGNQNMNSECWLSMAEWNIWLDLKYLVSVTNVTQENSHTNEGWRRLLTNVRDTEGQLKILALQGDGNWQSFAEAQEWRSHLKGCHGGKGGVQGHP